MGDAPAVNPSAEFWVDRNVRFTDVIREAEHSGCASGRARTVLIVSDNCSTPCVTTPPVHLLNRPQPTTPTTPGPLVTQYPDPMPEVAD